MQDDPVVKEVRKAREEYAKQFNYDIDAIYHDLKKQEDESDQEMVSFPAKRVKKSAA